MGSCGSGQSKEDEEGIYPPERPTQISTSESGVQCRLDGLVEAQYNSDDDLETCLSGGVDDEIIIGPNVDPKDVPVGLVTVVKGTPARQRENSPEEQPLPKQTHRQLPARFANSVNYKKDATPLFCDDFNFLREEKRLKHLREGGALFTLTCAAGNNLKQDEVNMLAHVLDPTSFNDELAENNIPPIKIQRGHADLEKHIFVLQKCIYLLPPPLSSADLPIEVLSSADFRKKTEPGNPTIWDDEYTRSLKHSYRLTKTVIPLIYKLTIQFKLTPLTNQEQLRNLSETFFDGVPITKAVLFERTKRDKSKTDAMKKMKMIYLMHDLPDGGCMCMSCGALTLTALPKVLAGLVNVIGRRSGDDYSETCTNFRRELMAMRKRAGKPLK